MVPLIYTGSLSLIGAVGGRGEVVDMKVRVCNTRACNDAWNLKFTYKFAWSGKMKLIICHIDHREGDLALNSPVPSDNGDLRLFMLLKSFGKLVKIRYSGWRWYITGTIVFLLL